MGTDNQWTCLIADDEPPARDILRHYVAQVPMLRLAGECANALQALQLLQEQPVDLLLLDIQMPQVSGIELIKALKHRPKIILTTAFEQYAVQGFDLDVSDYLVKPIQFDRFLRAVMKSLPGNGQPATVPSSPVQPVLPGPNFLYFRADKKMVKVLLEEILFIESLKDYQKIYTVRGDIITKHTMSALEAMLPVDIFIRVHRSYIVSQHKIDALTADQIMVGKHTIPIGKLYRLQVMKILRNHG